MLTLMCGAAHLHLEVCFLQSCLPKMRREKKSAVLSADFTTEVTKSPPSWISAKSAWTPYSMLALAAVWRDAACPFTCWSASRTLYASLSDVYVETRYRITKYNVIAYFLNGVWILEKEGQGWREACCCQDSPPQLHHPSSHGCQRLRCLQRHHLYPSRDQGCNNPDICLCRILSLVCLLSEIFNLNYFHFYDVQPDMIGHYLGEFAITYKQCRHGRPAVGGSNAARYIPLK